jgi:1-aminocyclopropane-1-carboxylate deaminase
MFTLPSPVTSLHFPLFEKKRLSLFLKRDDLIHPIISGNKWRKLKYTLEDARNKGQDHLVSFGGAYSNHLLALACAAATFGFKTTAFIRGEEVRPLNHILFLCDLYGMKLIYTDRQAYKHKQELYDRHFGADQRSRFIAEGGSSPFAVKGCAELPSELVDSYDHIFCAAGTGTTVAGIAYGAASLQMKAKVEGIAVLKEGEFLNQAVEKLAPGLQNWKIHTEFHEGGYAKTNAELMGFIQDFARRTGILLDQVYTGKLMKALFSLAENDYFEPGSGILAVHTGGWTGLLSRNGTKPQVG